MAHQSCAFEYGIFDVDLPDGFEGTGWAGDHRAAFIQPDLGLVLLIDDSDPGQRRDPSAPRFTLYGINPFSEPAADEPLVQADDYGLILEEIEAWCDD